MNILKHLILSTSGLIYPSFCIHCEEGLREDSFLCPLCQELLEMLNPSECCEVRYPFHEMHAVYEYTQVAMSLIRKLKYGMMPYLAKGMGSFMAAYWIKNEQQFPDMVVSVPQTPLRYLERGYNQSHLLGEQVANILRCELTSPLKRRWLGFSQAALMKEGRERLSQESFYLKQHVNITGKTILLIDDVMTTGKTLEGAGYALLEGAPKAIYALTFAKSL